MSNTGTALLPDTNPNTQIFSCLIWKVHPTSESQVSVLFLQPLCWNSQVAYQREDNGEPRSTNWKEAKKPLQFTPWIATCALHLSKAPDSHSHQPFISFQVSCSTCCHSSHVTISSTQRCSFLLMYMPPLPCCKGNSLCRGISLFYINFKN